MKILGIDIGTTSLSAVVWDNETGLVDRTMNVENGSALEDGDPFTRLQNPEWITEHAIHMIDALLEEYPDICKIGITGQMHGIVYLDSQGKAVSPLYTWQDRQGDKTYNGEITYCKKLTELTGYSLASGFGLVTVYAMKHEDRIPSDAHKIGTIMDFVCMNLTGRREPITHVTDAASMGLFDLDNRCFDLTALKKAGIDAEILPKVTDQVEMSGYYRGIEVYCGIGDNQSSFLGATYSRIRQSDEATKARTLLVNVGTGSQVSIVSDHIVSDKNVETRPFFNNQYLVVGASLSGGRAYAMLDHFFSSCISAAVGHATVHQYALMEKMAMIELDNMSGGGTGNKWDAYQRHCGMRVIPTFNGTRSDPEKSGSIININEKDFTPGRLILSFIDGMVQELYDYYEIMTRDGITADRIIGSGNGLRRNPLLVSCVEYKFGLKVQISKAEEEAAVGAAASCLMEES